MASYHVSHNLKALDKAIQILKEKQCYGRIKEALPEIEKELREQGESEMFITEVVFRLLNIAGASSSNSPWS